MTCKLSKINMHDALYNAARHYPGGIESLARRMGSTVGVLYNKLRLQVETHHITFEESAVIQEMLAEVNRADAFSALHSYAWRLGHVAVKLPDVSLDIDPQPILQHLCHTFKEEGDVARQIEESLNDDQRISERELESIEVEVMEAVQALMLLLEMCRLKHEQQ